MIYISNQLQDLGYKIIEQGKKQFFDDISASFVSGNKKLAACLKKQNAVNLLFVAPPVISEVDYFAQKKPVSPMHKAIGRIIPLAFYGGFGLVFLLYVLSQLDRG